MRDLGRGLSQAREQAGRGWHVFFAASDRICCLSIFFFFFFLLLSIQPQIWSPTLRYTIRRSRTTSNTSRRPVSACPTSHRRPANITTISWPSHFRVRWLTNPSSSCSRPRQSTPPPPILLPLLRLVPVPHQQPVLGHCPVRCHQEAVRPQPQDPAARQGRRAPEGRLHGRRRKGRRPGAQVLRRGAAAGVCRLHDVGSLDGGMSSGSFFRHCIS